VAYTGSIYEFHMKQCRLLILKIFHLKLQTTWDEAVAAKRYEMKSQEPLFEVDEEDLSESDGIYRTDSEVEDTEEELYLDSIDQVKLEEVNEGYV